MKTPVTIDILTSELADKVQLVESKFCVKLHIDSDARSHEASWHIEAWRNGFKISESDGYYFLDCLERVAVKMFEKEMWHIIKGG